MSTDTLVRQIMWSAGPPDNLRRLMVRVGDGDRAALRCLYAFLAVQVWRIAARELPRRSDAEAITHATFLQVWHCSRGAPAVDVRSWVAAIAATRIRDRLRRSITGQPANGMIHDAMTRLELHALLGAGRATVRIAPAVFARVDDLDDALAAIGAAWPQTDAEPSTTARASSDN